MDFLTNRPQHVMSGHICSTTITLNTCVPQVCILSPFLYSLFTHDCRPLYGSNSIIKLADDTTQEKGRTHNPIHVNGMAVERVSSIKFLGTHISEDLSWTTNTSSLVKKAHQHLFFLNTLKKNHLSSTILVNFYHSLVWELLSRRPQGTTTGGKNRPTHHRNPTSCN
ncbi:hypothetical protein QTP86_032016 [Hemibagrus guttatus]|nr:hypothetical protein QTP86_032016 [Hemibagrus guttatus]